MRGRVRAAITGLAWALPLLWIADRLVRRTHCDIALLLEAAERWLAGERLYVQVIDVNPPLIIWLSALPVRFEKWFGLLDAAGWYAALVGAAAILAALAVRSLTPRAAGRWAGLAAFWALVILPGYDFGQREHLMALCALPYVLASARRARGETPRGRIAAALLAAVGFALKPHFLAVPALVEAAVLLGRGRAILRDPVPWTMAAVWVVYLVSLPLVFPLYLGSVLPLVYEYYVDLGRLNAFWVLFTDRLGTAVWTVVMPVAWFALRRPGPPRMLMLAGFGALASAMAQHKGWSYHVVPVELFSGATVGLLVARVLDGVAFPRRIAAATALSGLLAAHAVAVGEAPWREIIFPSSVAGRLTAALREHAYGARVLVMTPDIYPIYPAINYAEARSTLRTMNLWLLQSTNATCLPDGRRYREVWEMSRAEFFMFRTVAEDAAKAPPSVILVSRVPGIPWCGAEFDFIEYFSRHPLFSELWKKYREVARVDHYRIYVREQ